MKIFSGLELPREESSATVCGSIINYSSNATQIAQMGNSQ